MMEVDRLVHLQSISDLPFIETNNFPHKIVLKYSVKDNDLQQQYHFQIENALICEPDEIQKQTPELKLISPKLPPNADAHILTKGTICYIFPGDILYNKGVTCGYAVEQSYKWAFGYEFYLREGHWPFAEVKHGQYPIFWGFSRPFIAA
jgi:hypothetical protein